VTTASAFRAFRSSGEGVEKVATRVVSDMILSCDDV
jgi:hypothetical protein